MTHERKKKYIHIFIEKGLMKRLKSRMNTNFIQWLHSFIIYTTKKKNKFNILLRQINYNLFTRK